ncbi:metabotropic glutamate receptor 3-like [Stylophora pistillata]|uniref:metabotropic glutamate receptor 3-like n=1 Tax=Stylophora pistillata TaxID=50429 RepID=UPI000C04FF59|nr:metabotropic glutamate receptor 3-like [Stylophora pistillata]
MCVNNCVLLAVVVSCGFLTSSGSTNKDRYHQLGDITLGALITLHHTNDDGECGDFSPTGLGHVEAMKFAIDTINRNPQLLQNLTLGYDIRDYCRSTVKAMKHTYDFVRKNELASEFQNGSKVVSTIKDNSVQKQPTPITAVIGPTDSGAAILVGSLLQVAEIPVISHSATSDELSSSQYSYFFRTAPPDRKQARAMADIVEYFHWSYVAAVAMDDSYGRNGVRSLEAEAARRQTFCLSFADYIPREKYIAKLARAVDKLRRHPNVRVVVLWLLRGYGRRFLEEAAKQKMFDRTWIFSDSLTAGREEFMKMEDDHRGVVHGSLGIELQHFDVRHFQDFLIDESIVSLKEESTSAPWWKEFWKQKGHSSTNETVIRSVYNSYIPYLVDAVFALAHAIHNINKIHTTVDPKELEKHLRQVTFKGVTGEIEFDQLGDPKISSYDIVHFQGKEKSDLIRLVIGSWNESREEIQLKVSDIKWNTAAGYKIIPKSFCNRDCLAGEYRLPTTSCCWTCQKCPDGAVSTRVNDMNCTVCPRGQKPNEQRSKCLDLPEVEVIWSSPASVLIILFATVGLLLLAICSFILFKLRNTPLVKAANRELSSILLLTIAMSFSSSILSLSKPTSFMCSFLHCWRPMILVTIFSILIIKTMKILSAFQINVMAERFKTFILATKRQTFIVLVLIFPPAVFSLLWIIFDSPHQQRMIQTSEGSILLSCSLYQSSVGMSFQIAICVYTSLLAVPCTYYAFKARTLPENFNEARYIGFSMYILLLSCVAYLPIDIGLKGSHATNLTCTMILVSSYGLLLCMFCPKIYVILLKPEENTLQAVSSEVSDYSFRPSFKGKTRVTPLNPYAPNSRKMLKSEFASTSNSTT